MQDRLDAGDAKLHSDVPPDVLALVLDGFLASEYTKKRIRTFIAEYKAAMKNSAP